jgi:hypothetical protein
MPKQTGTHNLLSGEVQAYGKMLDAFYPYVSGRGEVDLCSGAPDIDEAYEDLLAVGHMPEVVKVLAAKAIFDIPAIKSQLRQLGPEEAMEGFSAETA